MQKELKRKILVVDNNPVILKLMTNLLADQEGHEVRTADNGLEALDVLKSFTPEVIYVDLIMPKISGAKLCRIIRSKLHMKDVVLVILSAIAKESQEDSLPEGVDACIAKGPFKKTAKHVLSVLELVGRRDKSNYSRIVLGLDDVFQREVTNELITWKKHFEIILDNMSEAFFEVILPGRIIYLNARATSLFEMPEEEMLGASFADLFSKDQRERILSLLEKASQTSHSSGEKKPIVINGKQVVLNLLPIPDNDHESIIVMIQDITNRKKMEEKLHRVSITDDLTGLLNRRGFVNMADKQFKIADRKKDDLFLIYADLDNLKKINDNNGHQAGDQALLETAKILNKTFRQSDIIGRLGGDEFAVLTTSDVDPGRIGACERFSEALKESNRINDFDFKLDLSVGVARYDSKNPCSLEEFISQADSLMYECKKKKKGVESS